ncbi:putative Aminoglycoside phosphotransferase domain-containing protein [Seiridium cardinale]|uniref:Aminoglycoside phosphotransferase domain-containing protein n=1 Tax=Seiridium cardinale TaxID=138064 RepID=A0ABR2XTI2_9PEZI
MTRRFFDCSVFECGRPSARAVGAGCDMCSSYFCGVHMSQDFHKCSTGDLDDAAYNALIAAEIGRLRARINDKAVCEHASSLNDGIPCNIEYPSEVVGVGALTGCANYHARICFSNGSPSWLMRVPRVSGFAVGFPVSLAEYLIRSEYATLKFLETTAVPAPRAFSFGIPSQGTDHGIGVCFLLMEELSGRPWNGQGDTDKVWNGLADIFAELEKHPFTKAGSLYVEFPNDLPSVSATASDRFVCLDPYGPFETSEAYYAAWAEQYMTLIADGQLYPQFPVEAYLVYRFLQDNVAQLSDPEDRFFLKHVDDKGDHLMVDEDLNITGIIDWQMARIVPRREAFAPSLVSADMGALCDGKVSLSEKDVALSNALREKGPGLADYMRDEKVRRFFWGLGLEPQWAYALPLANAILQVFGVEHGWDEWKEAALKRYENDERLKALVEESSGNKY